MVRQKGLAPILIVLLIALVVGGYLFYQKQTKPVLVSQPSPSPVASPAISPIASGSAETVNWKTYTNKEYHFFFKYPSNASLGNETVDPDGSTKIFISDNQTSPYFIFTVNVKSNKKSFTVDQVVEQIANDIRNNKNISWGKNQADKMLQTMKPYKNGLIDGMQLEIFFEGYESGFGEVVYTTKDYIYIFNINNGNGEVGAAEEKMLSQILSTFKFTQ